MRNSLKTIIVFLILSLIIIIITACSSNDNELINNDPLDDDSLSSEFAEYSIILEIVDAENKDGLEEAVVELQNKDKKIIVAEEKDKKGVYEFSKVQLKKESDFKVYIMRNNYQSKEIKLLAEDEVISRVDDNAVFLDKLNLSTPESFDFNIKGDNSTGILDFNIKNIADKDGNIFTGDLIGVNKTLKIDYKNSKIKFYWYCSNSGYLHKATLFFDDIGFSDENFDKWKEKEFSSSKKFSDTVYEKDGMAYIKDEWFEFINMIHNFDQYEIIINLVYEEEIIELSSERQSCIEIEIPTGSAHRAIIGTVRDTEGNPIEEAEVLMWTETEKQSWRSPYFMTDENGEYGGNEVRLASESAHYLTVEKSGYESKEKEISLGVKPEHIKDGCGSIDSEPKIVDFILEKTN